MKKTFSIIFILIFEIYISSQEKTIIAPSEVNKLEIQNLLQDIESYYFKYLNFTERRIAINKLDQALLLIQRIPITPQSSIAIQKEPLSDDAFELLLQEVSSTINHNEKNRWVTLITKTSYFNCVQVRVILDTYTWDKDKIFLIKTVYPKIIDRQNIMTITTTISNSFERKDLENWILLQK